MSTTQQAELERFQQEIAGEIPALPTEAATDFLFLTSEQNDEPDKEQYNNEEYAEDEAAAAADIGLMPTDPEWTERLAGEHHA
ncbi:hypothetical protein FRC08_007065, partial [Ceratobasidium sp. 394]